MLAGGVKLSGVERKKSVLTEAASPCLVMRDRGAVKGRGPPGGRSEVRHGWVGQSGRGKDIVYFCAIIP